MTGDDGTAARLFVGMQHLLPQHLLSRAVHWLARNRVAWVKNALIDNFVVNYRPDMSEAAQPDPRAYESFNAFFTRALRADARPIDPAPDLLVSPVDGTVSQLGRADGPWLVQAKGLAYTLESLLDAAAPAWAPVFRGGAFATLYLAPNNYHRFHLPIGATLHAAWYVPGDLYSVNATTAVYIGVTEVGELHERCAARGARIVTSLADHPWGLRDFVVEIPGGHRLALGERIAPPG